MHPTTSTATIPIRHRKTTVTTNMEPDVLERWLLLLSIAIVVLELHTTQVLAVSFLDNLIML